MSERPHLVVRTIDAHVAVVFARGAANKVSSFWRIMLRVKGARKPAIFLLRMDLAGRPVF